MKRNLLINIISNRYLHIAIVLIVFLLLYSYRLLQIPPGLTADEAAFGYNATLLSRTGYDENNRFLPVFVLSLEGKDWRQPITQYYITFLFKLFGPSVYLLRFSTIIITLSSALLLYILTYMLLKHHYIALFSAFIFLTTPIVTIHTHLGLDNPMPIPFILIWLISLILYTSKDNSKFLAIAALSLGISYYTYKGMRATTPVWTILTLCYIAIDQIKKHKLQKKVAHFSIFPNLYNTLKPYAMFILTILPFYAITPLLEFKYAGAVFNGHQHNSVQSVYAFLYPYLSSFDFTFLFITGDALPEHSTGIHGMFLLAVLPLFLYGTYHAVKVANLNLILFALFSAPALYGLVDSVHRASRLMSMVPLFSIIVAYGFYRLLKYPKIIWIMYLAVIMANYANFIHYYWTSYPKSLENRLSGLHREESYRMLSVISNNENIPPCISSGIEAGASQQFFISIYFPTPPPKVSTQDSLSQPCILLSEQQTIPHGRKINTDLSEYYLHYLYPN